MHKPEHHHADWQWGSEKMPRHDGYKFAHLQGGRKKHWRIHPRRVKRGKIASLLNCMLSWLQAISTTFPKNSTCLSCRRGLNLRGLNLDPHMRVNAIEQQFTVFAIHLLESQTYIKDTSRMACQYLARTNHVPFRITSNLCWLHLQPYYTIKQLMASSESSGTQARLRN